MSAFLEVNIASAGYGTSVVLRDISFAATRGMSVAILGLNGSGKSTLLRCASTHPPCYKGSVRLNGTGVETIPLRQLARQVAAVPQEAARVPGMTVRQMVCLGRYPWLGLTGLYGQDDSEAVDRALDAVGMSEFSGRLATTLSGGEWQRALLARALAQLGDQDKPLLLLDELNAGLDMQRALEIFLLLEGLRVRGMTILMALHDVNLAALFATHLLGLHCGEMTFFGSVRETFNEDNLRELYGMDFILSSGAGGIPQILADLPCDVAARLAEHWREPTGLPGRPDNLR